MSTVPIGQWLAHRPRRGTTVVDTVVLHDSTAASSDALIHTLREECHSYHYIVDVDGRVLKCVPYSAVALHAGNSYGPHEAARGIGRERDLRHHFVEMTSVNEYTISICLLRPEGLPHAAFHREQVDACRTLLQDLKTPLPKLTYLVMHSDVAPGQVNPMEGIDLSRLAADAGLTPWVMPN